MNEFQELVMSWKYVRLLVFWGVVFVLSLFFIFSGFGNSSLIEINSLNELDWPNTVPESGEKPEQTGTNWNIILGIVTAVTSGAGFLATTIFGLREDRRDTALHALQIENLKKEIEQKDLEIEKLRQDQEPFDSL
jgi:hypothetical protein